MQGKMDDSRSLLKIAQHNLQHKYSVTISYVTDAQQRGIDALLLQDPYTHKIRDRYLLLISTAKYKLVAKQEGVL